MQPGKTITFSNIAAAMSIVLCLIAAAFSYHAHVTARNAKQAFARQTIELREDIERIENHIALLSTEASRISDQATEGAETGRPLFQGSISAGSDSAAIAAQQEELTRLKEIIDATGLKDLSEDGDVDLSFLKGMSQRRSRMMEMISVRDSRIETNRARLETDADYYGDHIRVLYQRASMQMGEGFDDNEREEAFNEVLERYPDSYAAASLLAERALAATYRQDVDSVEKYHGLLLASNNESVRDVLTRQGMEAMPAIETYLARLYIRDGRTEDAELIVDSLEENYPDSIVFAGRQGRRGSPFLPVSQVADQLRRALDSER